MTVDNYARKLFEYDGMKDMREKDWNNRGRNYLNAVLRTRTFEIYSQDINKNVVHVELFV
jgi:hypothetical protein